MVVRQGVPPLSAGTHDLKLHADPRSTYHAVNACGQDHVVVDGRPVRRSLLLLPDHLDESWGPDTFNTLATEHLQSLLTLSCDVLLLGTGQRQHFPAMSLLRPIYEAGRSIEVMDTPAACRTYNILVAEGRHVAAALIVEHAA